MFRSVPRVFASSRTGASVLSGTRTDARSRWGRCAAALLLGFALAACSPDYDWRTVMNNADGYTIDLPAKPTLDERQIDIGGTPMKMKMQAANAQGAVFAVGTVILPSDDAQLRQTVVDYLRAGLARNVGAAPEAHATEVPLAGGGDVPGLEMRVSGDAGQKREHRMIQVRLVARGTHVYQATIIADKAPPQEQIDQFFGSFKLD